MTTLPNFRFLLSHPAHFIALGFGSGLSPKAPGTAGTVIGIPLFLLLSQTPESTHYLLLAFLFLIGIPICTIAGNDLGVADHGSIVWDEIVAMMLVLECCPHNWTWWLIAFLLFRLFDIWKPFPIRQVDAKVKAGFGVMLDDLLAAVYSIISIKGLLWMMSAYSN